MDDLLSNMHQIGKIDFFLQKSRTSARKGTMTVQKSYLVSVILKISLASRPMKLTDSSTGGNFGIGMVVD